jgi:replication-associated recombination protein RarA
MSLTGKTTVARLYAQFLSAAGVIPGNHFLETSGSMLANEGVSGCQRTIEKILNMGGGALFIDEAYQLVQNQNYGGAQVLNYLLTEIENLRGKVVFILAGYQRQMEEFFAHNPGLPSRFPIELKFNDYSDKELMQILEYGIKKKYKGKMKVEGGMGGLYCRIVARRIGHGRGREGFGNARAVENVLAQIARRQAKRIKEERKLAQSVVDDLLFTKEDLIGREPSQALENCSAWQKLQSMIGLSEVKKTLKALLDTIQYNYQRELDEKPIVEFSLNKVFLGSPGTGKTTVAKLYGQILVKIGLLSNGEGIKPELIALFCLCRVY